MRLIFFITWDPAFSTTPIISSLGDWRGSRCKNQLVNFWQIWNSFFSKYKNNSCLAWFVAWLTGLCTRSFYCTPTFPTIGSLSGNTQGKNSIQITESTKSQTSWFVKKISQQKPHGISCEKKSREVGTEHYP